MVPLSRACSRPGESAWGQTRKRKIYIQPPKGKKKDGFPQEDLNEYLWVRDGEECK